MSEFDQPDGSEEISAGAAAEVASHRLDSRSIGTHQARHQREEMSNALRALLMNPLMTSTHGDFAAVRRHADSLREWFAREADWILHVERDCARLFKRPADLADPTRGFPDYDRRRYILFCLACAVLERSDPQITLRVLGDRLLALAVDPALSELGFTFTLQLHHERRELVAVCRHLLALGILERVAGDEDGYVAHAAEGGERLHDALYDVQRRVLAGVLAAVRGPSSWAPDEAPVGIEQRLQALTGEHVPDSDEGRRSAIRRDLSRRLLDDPVIYCDALDPTARAYFLNQRGAMAARLSDATGLLAEQRAEGLALVDETGDLTDVSMPAEGTEAHVTLLVAEFLSRGAKGAGNSARESDVAGFIEAAQQKFGRYWRKSAREPGAQRELTQIALGRLGKLRLIAMRDGEIRPLPALSRFALGNAEILQARTQRNLFPSTAVP